MAMRKNIIIMLAVIGHAAAWSHGAGMLLAGELTAEDAGERIFDLRVESGDVAQNKRVLRITQGDTVRLRWTTDTPMVIHLHGYDIEKTIIPGKLTEFSFKAHATGRFPVEVHGHGASHHNLPLLMLEVYPR